MTLTINIRRLAVYLVLAFAAVSVGLAWWQVIDAAGCRGLKIGGAQVSEMHCIFLINPGDATAADIEGLGETVRKRVRENSGIELEWEIKRIGVPPEGRPMVAAA